MHARTLLSILVLSASVVAAQTPPPLQHPHETGQPPQKLGQVSFETSCDPKLGADFNRAVALLHSFWFGASAAAFTAIAEKDPSCGMAWWGVAMSRWGNPFAPARPAAALKEGGTAIAKAVAAGAKDRSRAWPHRGGRDAVHGLRNGGPAHAHGQLRARDGAGVQTEPRGSRDRRLLCACRSTRRRFRVTRLTRSN